MHTILHSSKNQYQETNPLRHFGYISIHIVIILSIKGEYTTVTCIFSVELRGILIDWQLLSSKCVFFNSIINGNRLVQIFLVFWSHNSFATTFHEGWKPSGTLLFKPWISEWMNFLTFCVQFWQFSDFSVLVFSFSF